MTQRKDTMEDDLLIEKGIVIPPCPRGNKWGRGGRYANTLRAMEVGDSFVAPYKAHATIYSTCKRNGWRVTTRAIECEAGATRTMRVWLIDPATTAPTGRQVSK